MALPARLPKPQKRSTRWRSQAHTGFVRSFCCAMCGSTTNIEAAHVRMGSGTGMGQKPDDWRTVPLCGGLHSNADEELGCHNVQHVIGEPKFWQMYQAKHGQSVDQLLGELCAASPKAAEIRRMKQERANG